MTCDPQTAAIIDQAEALALEVLKDLEPELSTDWSDGAVETPSEELDRAPLWEGGRHGMAARLVIVYAELARIDPSPENMLNLGIEVERLRRFPEEVKAQEASARGRTAARRLHGVIDDQTKKDWQSAMDRIAAKPGMTRSRAWGQVELECGSKRETMEKYGVSCPIAARRGRIKKSSP